MSARTGKPSPPQPAAKALVLLAMAFVAAPSPAQAGGGPENALVVVNADSWASTYIANEYVAARHIPPANVVRLHDLPDFERMNVEDFRAKILVPVLQAAEQRGLAQQLDYILYSADFPWAIDVRSDMAGKQFPKVITQPASITGLTYLYQFTTGKNPGYLGLNVNFYYRAPMKTLPEHDWSEEDRKLYLETVNTLREKPAGPGDAPDKAVPPPPKLKGSAPPADPGLRPLLDQFLALRKRHPASPELLYNIACVQARMGEPIAAVGALRDAVDNGWWDIRTAELDPDLASIRGREDFAILAARARLVKYDLAPTSGFRGSVGWRQDGQWVPADKGLRYMISTVLASTSGRGNSVADAVASIRRSVAADGSHPRGTIYYMENRDVRTTTREWAFRRAVEKLRDIGVSAAIEDGVVPQRKDDVAGITMGSADFSWDTSGSRLLPGAIGDNLTSYGGSLAEGDGQTPLTEFLRNGAAGGSGTVAEPFAIQAKFPTPFIHFHYAKGCSLGEAYYQSVLAPYQLLIVGDALCTPWKKELTVVPGELAPGATLKGLIHLAPTARSSDAVTAGAFELYLDGRRVAAGEPGKPLDFDSTQAADGPHEITVAADGNDTLITRGSVRIPVVFRNGTSDFHVTPVPPSIPWNKAIAIRASAPGAKAILFYQNVDKVATIEGESGAATIDPRILGQGPVCLQPVAMLGNGKEVLADPVRFVVTPPPAMPAPASYARKPYADGFTVTHSGGKQSVVQKAADNWLRDAGVGAGEEFAVQGYFFVATTDVYQFQVHGAAKLRVSVDGQPQSWPHGSEWKFFPIHLGSGRHVVRIEGTAGAGPLDIRFGGPGSSRLDGRRFQHPNNY